MREIRIHRTYFTLDDVCDGDIPRDDTHTEVHDERWMVHLADFHGNWNDDDTVWVPATISQVAAELISEAECGGRYSYSDSSGPSAHGWYSPPDGSIPANEWDANYTGRRMEVSAHLSGFTEAEEMEIFLLVTGERAMAL